MDLVKHYAGCDLRSNELAEVVLSERGAIPVEDGHADVVLSTQALEHVDDPRFYLAECRRVLRQEGRLILTTHGAWRYHPDPVDYWRWTSAGLRKILMESGFSIVHFRGVMGPASTALQLWQDAVLPRLHWRFTAIFTTIMQQLIKQADLRCPSDVRDQDACVFVILATKLDRS
jgi:SAM-dependent methyltransferase